MKHILVFVLLLCAALFPTDSVRASVLDQQYTLYSPQGLSSGTAYRVVRDKEGFIWVSTRNGIDRYDGSKFRHYRLNGNTVRGIHDGMMIYLYQDDQGELWVYTERSIVYHYNPMTDIFEQAMTFPIEDTVGSLQDMYVFGNEIIFGVSNGLMSYEKGPEMKRVANLLSDREVRCIKPYKDGCLLIGTNKGLAVYDPVQHRATTIYERLFVDVKTVYYDPIEDKIWVGAHGQGLYVVDEKDNGRFTRVGNEPLVVYTICPVENNELLVATDGNGLKLVRHTDEGYELTLFASDNESANYLIHCSCVRDVISEEGNLWLAMHFGGIVKFQPASSIIEMGNYDSAVPADRYAFGADFDDQNRVWVAFNQSIGCFGTDGQLQGMYLDHVARYLTVMAAPDGTVWCGGFNTGLYHFDPLTGEREFFSSVRGSSTNDCVYAIHTDPRGYIWVGGLDFGLTCLIPSPDRKIGDDPIKSLRFEHTSIRQVCDIDQVNDSSLVVATSDGLYLYNYYTQRQLHLFLVDDNSVWKGSNFFCSCAVRNGHEIWIATDGAGLMLYDLNTKRITSFGLEEGLPSLQLRGVELVNDSTLCLSSELDGIFSFDCKHHTFLHRLYYVEGSQFQQNAIATNGKGLVVSGCDKCAVLLSEGDMVPRQVQASIHIDGHPIVDGKIVLPSDAANLNLSFAMTDIAHQSEYHFFCKIDGLDDDWVHLDEQRHLEYHKVPTGNYIINVRAVGAGGQSFERSVRLEVERNLKTLVPYILLLLAASLAVGVFHLYLFRKRRRA